MDCVGGATGCEEAIRLRKNLHPDLVLVDLAMPGIYGRMATQTLRENCPDTRVISLTSFKEQEMVRGMIEAEAIGYLLEIVTALEWTSPFKAVDF